MSKTYLVTMAITVNQDLEETPTLESAADCICEWLHEPDAFFIEYFNLAEVDAFYGRRYGRFEGEVNDEKGFH